MSPRAGAYLQGIVIGVMLVSGLVLLFGEGVTRYVVTVTMPLVAISVLWVRRGDDNRRS